MHCSCPCRNRSGCASGSGNGNGSRTRPGVEAHQQALIKLPASRVTAIKYAQWEFEFGSGARSLCRPRPRTLTAVAIGVEVATAVVRSLWHRAKRSRRESRSSPFVFRLKFTRGMQPDKWRGGVGSWCGSSPISRKRRSRR